METSEENLVLFQPHPTKKENNKLLVESLTDQDYSYITAVKDTFGNIIGYSVSNFPNAEPKKWTNKNKTINEKFIKAVKYLTKLKGPPSVPPSEISLFVEKIPLQKDGIKSRKNGFSVKDCNGKNHYFIDKTKSTMDNYNDALVFYNEKRMIPTEPKTKLPRPSKLSKYNGNVKNKTKYKEKLPLVGHSLPEGKLPLVGNFPLSRSRMSCDIFQIKKESPVVKNNG